MYVISHNNKINILQDAGIQKLFFSVSSTPLLVLDAEMDMGTAPIKSPYCNTHQRIAIRIARVPARKVLCARGTG